MVESRWLRWVGPGWSPRRRRDVASVRPVPGSGLDTPACADGGDGPTAVRRTRRKSPATSRRRPGIASTRAGPGRALEGQRLALGLGGTGRPVPGPARGVVRRRAVRPDRPGRRGRRTPLAARRLDVDAVCSWTVAEDSAVIRRATIDPDWHTVYEIRVDRATRADLGVWSRPLDGSPRPSGCSTRSAPTSGSGRPSRPISAGTSRAAQPRGPVVWRGRLPDACPRSRDRALRVVQRPGPGTVSACPATRSSATRRARVPLPRRGHRTGDRLAIDPGRGGRRGGRSSGHLRPAAGPEFFDAGRSASGPSRWTERAAVDLGRLPGTSVSRPDPVPPRRRRGPRPLGCCSARRPAPGQRTDWRRLLRHVPDGATVQLEEVVR